MVALAVMFATAACGAGRPSAVAHGSKFHTSRNPQPSSSSTTSQVTSTQVTAAPTKTTATTSPRVAQKPAATPAGPPTAHNAGPSISGCPIFPSDNAWNTDVSSLPVDPHSSAWIANSGGASGHIHPDFGDSGSSVPYGIPFIVTNASHPKVSVSFEYADESDPGPYPFGPDTPIEGGAQSDGDRHAIMLDSSTCTLYELYDACVTRPKDRRQAPVRYGIFARTRYVPVDGPQPMPQGYRSSRASCGRTKWQRDSWDMPSG